MKVLHDCGIHTAGQILHENSQWCDTLPPHKRRTAATAFKEALALLKDLKKCDKDDDALGLQAYSNMDAAHVEITNNNIYEIFHWSRVFKCMSINDVKKIKSQNWKPLRHSLCIREKDIAWKFKHGAICTPQIAFHMGLTKSTRCFFCSSTCPSWRHLLVCENFTNMWELCKSIVTRAGGRWSRNVIFNGFHDKELLILNHVLH